MPHPFPVATDAVGAVASSLLLLFERKKTLYETKIATPTDGRQHTELNFIFKKAETSKRISTKTIIVLFNQLILCKWDCVAVSVMMR